LGALPALLALLALPALAGCFLDFDGLSGGDSGGCADCSACVGEGACEGGSCAPLGPSSPGYTPFRVAVAPGGALYGADPEGFTITRVAPGEEAETLSVPSKPFTIAVNATHLFWSAGEGLFRCELPGCSKVTQLAPGGADTAARQLAVDGDAMFWITGPDLPAAKVMRCTINDCVPQELADAQYRAHAMVLDGPHIFWTNHATGSGVDGKIMRIEKAGGGLITYLGDLTGPSGLAADKEYLYFSKGEPDGHIYRCRRGADSCGASEEITSPSVPFDTPIHTPLSVTVDAERVYWTNDGDDTLMACPLIGCATTPDGLPTIVATGLAKPGGILSTGGCLFWASEEGVFASTKPAQP
jgi:hypothetical protein